MTAEIIQVNSQPFQDQKPGTSGLRKKVKTFQQPNYTENFIQSIFDAVSPKTLVIGGDGRYLMKETVQIIIKMAAANNVKKLIIGKDGILSTPAASNLIRKRKADGGIILTASHNPGGPDNDFGIKYNVSNGGPAPENVTDKIYATSKQLKGYRTLSKAADVDLSSLGTVSVVEMSVEIVDSVEDYVLLMKQIFDFDLIKNFLHSRQDFKFVFDAMNGVTGPYGNRLFLKELGLPSGSVIRGTPLFDFGGEHPDPNLTYAKELVDKVAEEKISFGCAADGDGDRNMIIAHDIFVNPCDSVAVIAANYEAIPYFKKSGLKGVARSMPTSCALDRVAESKKVKCYETPTGWKFFGNLMDAGHLSICGEESFGTGSDHVREKDGLWAIMAWLSILAFWYKHVDKQVSIKSVLTKHFETYGRNFFTRYDYEEVDSDGAKKMIDLLKGLISDRKFVGKEYGGYKVAVADDFTYTDPIDHSVSKNQGIRIVFTDTSRLIFRLSGTGSSGATIRLYVEKYSNDKSQFHVEASKVLEPLIKIALEMSKLPEFTGRLKPSVVT